VAGCYPIQDPDEPAPRRGADLTAALEESLVRVKKRRAA
jgi:hypothetical protein